MYQHVWRGVFFASARIEIDDNYFYLFEAAATRVERTIIGSRYSNTKIAREKK